MVTPTPERWLLRCPVDEALIAPGVADCPDCGLSTAPLRALASIAANQLQTAAVIGSDLAGDQVAAASNLVPESENFLLDAGRALGAAGDYEAARDALERASGIAPGRKDIKAEVANVSSRIDPTAWLVSGPPSNQPSAALPSTAEAIPEPLTPTSPKSRLMIAHAEARSHRDTSQMGGDNYRAACLEVARIEVEIAALSLN